MLAAVDLAQRLIHVAGASARDVALSPPMRAILQARGRADEPVLASNGRAITPDAIKTFILCAAHDARIDRASEVDARASCATPTSPISSSREFGLPTCRVWWASFRSRRWRCTPVSPRRRYPLRPRRSIRSFLQCEVPRSTLAERRCAAMTEACARREATGRSDPGLRISVRVRDTTQDVDPRSDNPLPAAT